MGAIMLRLPGRTSEHGRVSVDEAARAPGRNGFELGRLTWDMAAYSNDARLEPLRQFLTEHCAGLSGLDAAKCLSTLFAVTFPHGTPSHQFVDGQYDPVADLTSHMTGAPGYCVTRSGLIAAILLSAGTAARQIQFSAPHDNIVEVFDERWGWVLVDPTFGAVYRTNSGPSSAAALLRGEEGHWMQEMPSPPPHLQPTLEPSSDPLEVVFPDPWLYTRSGVRVADWPFRGFFVHAGARSWRSGWGQQVARWTACTLILAVIAVFASAFARSRRRTPVDVPGSASDADAMPGMAEGE
jgi:hypothetical protein